MENFQKKNASMVTRPQVTSTSAAQVSEADGETRTLHNRKHISLFGD
jgi:hypothetical protein